MRTKYDIEIPTPERGWLTVYCGPPRSGKSEEINRQASNPEIPPFSVIEGGNEKSTLDSVETLLISGKDVILETNLSIMQFCPRLLEMLDMVEVFKLNRS